MLCGYPEGNKSNDSRPSMDIAPRRNRQNDMRPAT
jgi:hypothetical protein